MDEDPAEDAVAVIDDENPQIANIVADRDEAEAIAARLNAQHDNRPFVASVGGDGDRLVTASAVATRAGRWAVVLVIEARAV